MYTVLIVEDDNVSRKMLQFNLENSGYKVIEATNGKEALELLVLDPDLILLDITLPDINGLDLLKEIKNVPTAVDIPIILASGRDTEADIIRGLNSGGNDYITKPYRWDMINARLKNALRMVTMHRELKESLFEARQASLAKAEFLANMSHEIRTPLNGILGMIQLMEDTKLDAEQKDYSRIINSSGEQLLSLINNVLDLSKIETGCIELENLSFEMETLIDEVVDMQFHKINEKKLNVFFNFSDEGCGAFIGDPGRIKQILLNFTNNAIKFTADGHICFELSQVSSDGEKAVIRLTVHDTGIGIRQENQQKLFQKFTQADSSTTRKFGGSGLGLSICRHLANLMGGHVGFDSEEGKGSSFWMELPLIYSSVRKTPQGAKVASKILIVDDNSFSSSLIAEILQSQGHECTRESSVPLGLSKRDFDLLVIDHSTYTKGDSQTSSLQRFDDIPHLLLWNGNLKDTDEAALLAAGFHAVLSHPLQPSLLRKMVDTLLDKEHDYQKNFLSKDTLVRQDSSRLSFSGTLFRDLHFLIVDDNIVNQKITAMLLSKMGAEVAVAGNGLEAVKMVARFDYHVVLMDCEIPEVSGFEATQMIKGLEGKKDVPIIAMTANALISDRQKCIKLGMDDYVSKPISKKALVEVIQRQINKVNC